jgi:hypothetical protein
VVATGAGDRVTVVIVAGGGAALVDVVSETAAVVVVLVAALVVVPVANGAREGPAQATRAQPASITATANG